MLSKSNMRLGLIIIAAVVFILLINSYNNGSVDNRVEDNSMEPAELQEYFNVNENETNSPLNNQEEVNEVVEEVPVQASEPLGENEQYNTVEQNNLQNTVSNEDLSVPNECYPKDTLTPQELLPADSNSTWAQTVPAGQGSLGDQNFLNAGFHVGINTVGQSLRNANLQLRSEPSNPQVKVSPWLQTTIGPDVNRKAMEIGGCD